MRIDFFFIFGRQKMFKRMKKIYALLAVAVTLVVAGCNKEKVYVNDLTGTWHIYKYLYRNVDETAQFLSANSGYTITFTSDKKFTETYVSLHDTIIGGVTYQDTVYSLPNSGTYAFADKDVKLVLTDSTWRLVNDTTLIRTPRQRTYTIFNLSGSNVQLNTDTTQAYYAKNM